MLTVGLQALGVMCALAPWHTALTDPQQLFSSRITHRTCWESKRRTLSDDETTSTTSEQQALPALSIPMTTY
jgi:hypothetical protein